MSKYIIKGGVPLSGRIRASGNKNAALPCIAATLLSDEPVILHELPEIEDVRIMIAILRQLGSTVERLAPGSYLFKTGNIQGEVDEALASAIRASILCAGPILARAGSVRIAPPGGDVIGHRRLDTHFLAFSALGVVSRIDDAGWIECKVTAAAGAGTGSSPRMRGAVIFLDEASVTATENAIMAAVLAEGRTVIRNAASEPHVQDLCEMLVAMGAGIEGVGSNLISVRGVDRLHGAEFTIGPDYMEIGSFIGLAAATRGEMTIEGVRPDQLPMIRLGFERIGITWETSGSTINVPREQRRIIQPEVSGMIPKIDDAPWPGFPADLLSIVTVAATQVEGTVLIHEKMFESRMFFIDMLIRMGARIILCDPHRAVVSGPARLTGALVTSPDVRAGMSLVIAALCAQGESEIQNVFQIERGYERLCERLTAVGANIRKVD